MSNRNRLLCITLVGLLVTSIPTALLAQCGTLVDPGFENSALGDFGSVVDPQFTPGFWGDENSAIVASSSACPGVTPFDGSKMLEMSATGYYATETWQVVEVGPTPMGSLTASAWFNACAGITPTATINIKTFNSATGWPNATTTNAVSLDLDSDAATWEKLVLECIEIPLDTTWILIDVQFREAELAGKKGFVDDVTLECGCEVVPNEGMNWGNLKALYN